MTEESRTSFSIVAPRLKGPFNSESNYVPVSGKHKHLKAILGNCIGKQCGTWRPRHPHAVLAEKVNVNPY